MKPPKSFGKILGAALLSGVVVAAHAAEPASESTWYSPLAAVAQPGALTPKADAAPQGRAKLMLTNNGLQNKGLQLMRGRSKAPFGIDALPQLQYFGGPLLGNVKIQLVYWNSAVAYQDKLPGFYSTG
jgi:hypothetical protein